MLRSRWLLLTIVVPLVAWLLDRVGARLARRRGESDLTRALRWPHARRRRRATA